MTSAVDLFQFQTPALRSNWLGRYLDIEKSADKDLFQALADATAAIDKSLLALKGSTAEGAAVRRVQLALAHKEIRKEMTSLFGDVGNLIRGYNGKAAVAAVDAALSHETRTLGKLFKTKADRANYSASLRQSAQRNIESVVTRVLATQQPLSQRVYKTRALANGMVSKALNNGLARGDSADLIAVAVHDLISPNVIGGVSYAAKRLARTEIGNAFHAQSIASAQDQPWVHQMRWNLSKQHRDDPGDYCEDYAQIGLFPVENIPDKPHPNCRCFVTPEVDDDDTFDNQLFMGHFDAYLDEFISSGTLDANAS
jgi:hypothetical protein